MESNLLEAIEKRRSIRKYKAGMVMPREHIEGLLKAQGLGYGTCWYGVYPNAVFTMPAGYGLWSKRVRSSAAVAWNRLVWRQPCLNFGTTLG